jgi:chemotaxis protein methyltransferase WspC
MTKDQEKIELLLARRIGLDPSSLGPHLILGAARRRMAELGVNDLRDYAALTVDSEVEQQALIEEVVVPESWFFRDDRPFRWLADQVPARWITSPRRPPLHALSMPCAGGQEPYSIAITLRDAGLPAGRFRIDAVDVSARLLEIARRGIYSANALRSPELKGLVHPPSERGEGLGARDSIRGEGRGARGEPEESPVLSSSPLTPNPSPLVEPFAGRWARYFRRHAEGYEIDPALRSTVRFLQANVLDPALLADSPPYDVVFCRNLLIYLDTPARARVLATIDRLLADDGVLFIGHADRLDVPGMPSRFAALGEPGCFAYRKAARPADPDGPGLEPAPPTLMPMPMLPEPTPMSMLPTASPGRALPTADAPATDVAARPPAPSLLERAAELANRGRHGEAIAACEQHLRLKGPGASAYYLMGMICQAAGDRRRAEDCFHKAIYLDPGHDEALLALALLAERRGDRGAAAGFRRRARRSAAMPANMDHGPEGRTTTEGERRS